MKEEEEEEARNKQAASQTSNRTALGALNIRAKSRLTPAAAAAVVFILSALVPAINNVVQSLTE